MPSFSDVKYVYDPETLKTMGAALDTAWQSFPALIAVTFAVFLLNGGEHVGKKTVKGDADLPPVATGQPR